MCSQEMALPNQCSVIVATSIQDISNEQYVVDSSGDRCSVNMVYGVRLLRRAFYQMLLCGDGGTVAATCSVWWCTVPGCTLVSSWCTLINGVLVTSDNWYRLWFVPLHPYSVGRMQWLDEHWCRFRHWFSCEQYCQQCHSDHTSTPIASSLKTGPVSRPRLWRTLVTL